METSMESFKEVFRDFQISMEKAKKERTPVPRG
jgi:hypothetical protein